MSLMWRARLCAAIAGLLSLVEVTAGAVDAEAFAFRTPIATSAQGGLQRLAVPLPVLWQAQTADLSDVRVFNAQGQAMPMALMGEPPASASPQRLQLSAYPIGASKVPQPQGQATLELEHVAGQKVARLSVPDTATSGNPIWGALVDVRAVDRPVIAMTLDARVPPERVIAFEFEISQDLQTWRKVGRTVVYQSQNAPLEIGQTIELPPQHWRHHYLRITWPDAQQEPVRVKGVRLDLEPNGVRVPRLRAAVSANMKSPREGTIAVPVGIKLASVHIKAKDPSALVPVRIFGRSAHQRQWLDLGSTVVFNLPDPVRPGAVTNTNPPVDLPARTGLQELRWVADAKNTGFATPPEVEIAFEPVHIVFLGAPDPSHILAAGLPSAPNAYLPMQTLIPGYSAGAEWSLPEAQWLEGHADPTRFDSLGPHAVPQPALWPPTTITVLWAALATGVLVLLGMAWVLMRQPRR